MENKQPNVQTMPAYKSEGTGLTEWQSGLFDCFTGGLCMLASYKTYHLQLTFSRLEGDLLPVLRLRQNPNSHKGPLTVNLLVLQRRRESPLILISPFLPIKTTPDNSPSASSSPSPTLAPASAGSSPACPAVTPVNAMVFQVTDVETV
jgi:hypothetical protein